MTPNDIILIIACGGSSNTIQDLQETLIKLKDQKQELPTYKLAEFDKFNTQNAFQQI